MSAVLPALLAGAAVCVAGGLPARAALRLDLLRARPAVRPPSPRAAGALVVVLVAVVLGAGPALLAAAAAVAAPRVLRTRAASQGRHVERRRAVEACAALAAELRAGRTPAQALQVAADLAGGPSASALRAAASAALWGGSVPGALRAGAERSSVPEVLRGLAACWQVCAQAGSGLAAAVERLADGLRARQAQERAVAATLAGPRASAALLALLPLAGVALAAGLGARPLHVLLHTPLGLVCLVVGLALDVLGLLWTRQLVVRAAGSAR